MFKNPRSNSYDTVRDQRRERGSAELVAAHLCQRFAIDSEGADVPPGWTRLLSRLDEAERRQ
ncbi:hypothetical protein BH23PSE1_BH23PSE1_06070 [soil metagenome]